MTARWQQAPSRWTRACVGAARRALNRVSGWRSAPSRRQPKASGPYLPLYQYLRDRHANRVVLTFAEVESLVGFPLPPAARAEPGWWSGPNAVAGEAWRLADRSAVANLVSQVVVCERLTAPAQSGP